MKRKCMHWEATRMNSSSRELKIIMRSIIATIPTRSYVLIELFTESAWIMTGI